MDIDSPKPMVHWHNAETGETIVREMTDEEIAELPDPSSALPAPYPPSEEIPTE